MCSRILTKSAKLLCSDRGRDQQLSRKNALSSEAAAQLPESGMAAAFHNQDQTRTTLNSPRELDQRRASLFALRTNSSF
jgi:hypothetical protein